MSSGHIDTALDARIRVLSVMPTGADRGRELTAVLVALYPHFRAWAWREARAVGGLQHEDQADIVQVIAERVLQVLADPKEVAFGAAYLRRAASFSVRGWFAGEHQLVSGATSAIRRLRMAARTRDDFVSREGRNPTIPELVETHNAIMVTRRKNASRQSVLIDEESAAELLG